MAEEVVLERFNGSLVRIRTDLVFLCWAGWVPVVALASGVVHRVAGVALAAFRSALTYNEGLRLVFETSHQAKIMANQYKRHRLKHQKICITKNN